MDNAYIYATITAQFIEGLKDGVLPWNNGVIKSARPANYKTSRPYNGINWLLLTFSKFSTPYFLTFNQAQSLGIRIKKGSKGMPIIFFKRLQYNKTTREKITDDSAGDFDPDDIKIVRYIQYSHVFNLEQTDAENVLKQYQEDAAGRIISADAIITSWPACPPIESGIGQNLGSYSPLLDKIYMPQKWQYDNPVRYYKTLFHEMVHASGAEHRLNRPSLKDYEKNRAFEELIAEIGAMFLCQVAGIATENLFENSKAYVNSWIADMQNDPQYIFRAAHAASAAVDYILDKKAEAAVEAA